MLQLRARRSPRTPVVALLLVTGVVGAAGAQTAGVAPTARPAADAKAPGLRGAAEAHFGLLESIVVEVDLAATPGEPCAVSVPIDGRWCTLELEPHSVRADGYRLAVQREGGDIADVDPGPVRTLRGSARELAGSTVAATLMKDGLHAMIVLPDDRTLWLQPLESAVAGARATDYVLYDDVDVVPSGGGCDVVHARAAELEHGAVASHASATEGGAAGVAECVWTAQLALEADFPYFATYGTVADTQAKIESVINTVNLQFERDVQIAHEITGLLIRTSAEDDPYTNLAAPQLLSQFRDQWRFIPPIAVEHDLAHLFTGRNLDGSTVGVAWSIGMVCTNGAYCLTQSDCCSPNLACATDLSAHELGHLWGADHCTCASPAYSMNDFITCINRFHPDESVPEIIAHRNSRPCVETTCAPPNDACIDGTTLTDGAWPFSTVGAATNGPSDSACTFGSPDGQVSGDVWYWYQATCDGTVSVDVCDADYDSRLAVYASFCPGSPNTALACDDNSCGDGSRLSFAATSGSWYIFRVGGYGAQQGDGTITVSCGSACATDLDGNGATDVDDLMVVIFAWGTADAVADVDDSGVVDIDDLIAVIGGWGSCP